MSLTWPRRHVAAALCGLVALALGRARTHAGETREWQEVAFPAMSTRISALVPAQVDAEVVRAALKSIFEQLEQDLNEWRPGAPLAVVNDHAGEAPIAVPADLLSLVERGIELGRLSDGAFDITWAALWPLWTFDKQLTPPAADAVSRAVSLVDFRRVVVDRARGMLYLPTSGMKIGLGGIAKGYALDQAAERLRALGLADFLLAAGGQVLAAGTRDGAAWRVGLRDPRGATTDLFASVELAGGSVSTSGDYERYFESDGVRYHHILDPHSGWPSRGLRSATAIAPDGTLADALSTAFMVLGTEASLALVARLAAAGITVEAVLVDDRGQVHTSAGIAPRLRLRHTLRAPEAPAAPTTKVPKVPEEQR